MIIVLGAVLCSSAYPVVAQYSAELEVERNEEATTTRFELLDGRFYALRAERRRAAGINTDRLGGQLPGRLFGLDGYTSLFLERRPGLTAYGTNFELGRGLLALGGSVERADLKFKGVYVKLGEEDLQVAIGGGERNSDAVWHGAVYAKGTRFSLAGGGSTGPGDTSYQHLAGTWHPAERGGASGGWFIVERDGPTDYLIEVNVAHRATFDHLTVWGAYGMDQWPHEKSFEALGDLMRYFRPSILNHERSGGAGVLGARYKVSGGEPSLTLDARAFPFRIFRGSDPAAAGQAAGGETGRRDLRSELLGGLMVGLAREVRGGDDLTLLGEVRLDPIVLYAELHPGAETNAYLFLQYVVRGWF